MTAIALLTRRTLLRGRVDLVFAVLMPIFVLAGLTLLLRDVIATGQMSYTQYVLPAVVVQAMLFGALTTTDRAAWDAISGLSTRMRTLPISPNAMLTARMVYCLIRGGWRCWPRFWPRTVSDSASPPGSATVPRSS